MASMSFPSNPSHGDKANGYTYDSATQTWEKPVVQKLSDIADIDISNLQDGSKLFYSQTSQKWVAQKPVIPSGKVFSFAGSSAPQGYLFCDGSVVSQSTYPALYSVVGTSFNTGSEGSGNFRLPSLSGRVPVGHDSSNAAFTPVGKTGGEKTVTLITNQLPSHTHTQKSHNHIQDSHNHSQDAHSHGYTIPFYPSGWEAGGYGTGYYGSFRGRAMVTNSYSGLGTDGRTPYIQNTTATNQNATAINQNTGGGGAHANLQPYIVLNYIIKT